MQFMPQTAQQYGIDPLDPTQAVSGARQYLTDLIKQFGSLELALMAYNWGPGNLKKFGRDQAPKETVDYVRKVLARLGKEQTGIPDSLASQPANPMDKTKPPEPKSETTTPSNSTTLGTPGTPGTPDMSALVLASMGGSSGAGTGGTRRGETLPNAPTVPSLAGKESPIEMVEKLLKSPTSLATG